MSTPPPYTNPGDMYKDAAGHWQQRQKSSTYTPPPGQGGATDLESSLTGAQRDAYAALKNMFNSFGLGTLAGKIFDYVKKGYSSDTVSILLQDTPEYKERFAGNELRKAKGLPVLSPAQYLSTESSYRQLMQQAGLPPGFYDQASDFNQFIGKDVSPSELSKRIDLASQTTSLASPELKQAMQKLYGIDEGHLTAYFLDEERALPALQKQAAAAAIGAEALKRGLRVSSKAEDYALSGVTATQAAQAYGTIAEQLPEYSQIGHQYGMNVGQGTFEQALFQGGEAQNQITKLASWSRANAQGQAGAAAAGLGGARAGQI